MSAAADMMRAYRAIETLVMHAWSGDGLVRVAVGAAGNLRDLRLDPRIGRRPDGGALADTIVHCARQAATGAAVRAGELARALMPDPAAGAPADPVFGPALAQLDRLSALPPPEPRADGRPVVRRPDLTGLRDGLLGERERRRTARATATSPDGLVTATAGGQGELLALSVDDRVFRRGDARWLAGAVLATVRAAHRRAGGA